MTHIALLLTVLVSTLADPNSPAIPASPNPGIVHDPVLEAALAAAEAARMAAEASRAAAMALQQCTQSASLLHSDIPQGLPDASPFSFKFGLSALAVGGNANAWSGKVDAGLDGTWKDWNAELRLSGAYGQTSDSYITARPLQVTASKGDISLRGERNYNPVLGVYLKGGGAFDRVSSVAWRVSGEGGISLLWWEDQRANFLRSRLRTSLGFAAIRESRYQYYPIPLVLDPNYKNIYGPAITGNFRFGLSRMSYFTEDFEILEDINDAHDLRFNSTSALTAQLKDGVALSFQFTWHYVGSPPAGKKPNDYELAAGINWTW